MPTRKDRIHFNSVAGALIGAAAGWGAGSLAVPGLEAPIASVGTYAGGKAANLVVGSSVWQEMVRKRVVTRYLRGKAQADLRNLSVLSSSAVARALRESNESLGASRVIGRDSLRHRAPDILDSLDYSGSQLAVEHTRVLCASTNVIRVSCPPLFVGALLTLMSLKATLSGYGVQLIIDDSAISSKEQLRHLALDDRIDLAFMAESAYYLSPQSLNMRSRFARLMPCYAQEDCLLAVGAQNEPNWKSKIFFHEESTAEVALRTGPLWGRPRMRSPLESAADIAPLVASLDQGAFVTTWEPITSALLSAYKDVSVVPGSRFKGFISLFAGTDWLDRHRAEALVAFASLFIRELKRRSNARLHLADVASPRVLDTIDEMCGVSFLAKNAG
jgi:hypothetical protein